MNIREIRKMTGLSQARFGEKYGIPTRTIEDWEAERRTAPEYVIEMLTKVVKMEQVNMTAWYFIEYRVGFGTGTEKRFKTRQEAEEYARDEWDRMSNADRESYRKDPGAQFFVAELAVEWDDYEEDWTAPSYDCTPVWDALSEKSSI